MQILQFPDSSWGLTVLKNIFLRFIGLKGLKMVWKKSSLIWNFFAWFPWLEKVFKIFPEFPDQWEPCHYTRMRFLWVNEHPLIPISFLRISLSLQTLELNTTCRIKCFLSCAPPREQTCLSILTMLHLLPVPSWLFEHLDDQWRGRWHHWHFSLSVLDGELYRDPQTLPVLCRLCDVVSYFLGRLKTNDK